MLDYRKVNLGSPDDNQNLEGETYSAGMCQVVENIILTEFFFVFEQTLHKF
jgi:hypothetical protein